MGRAIGTGVLLVVLVSTSGAFADDPPAADPLAITTDTVHLRNGGLVRGRVIEIVPNDHVVILVVGGEQRRFAWAEVDRVAVGTGSMPAPAAAPPAGDAPIVGPVVRVHVKASGIVYLYRRGPGMSDFVKACESPCDRDLPAGDTYKAGGSGITTTKEFRIDAPGGSNVELDIDGPSWLGIAGGGTLVIAGIAVGYVGLVFAAAGTGTGWSGGRSGGLIALAAGVAMVGLGFLIVIPSTKTDVTQEAQKPPSRDGWVRVPRWRAADATLPRETFPVLLEGAF